MKKFNVVVIDKPTNPAPIDISIGRTFRPDKEKHLAALADNFINSLRNVDHGYCVSVGGPHYMEKDICAIIGMQPDENNNFSEAERAYAKNLYEAELIPYLSLKWAQMRNLGDL